MAPSALARPAAALLAVLLPVSLLAASCTGAKPAEGAKKDASARDGGVDEAVPVELHTLETGEIEAVLRFSANLEAERQVEVLARAGGQVRQVLVEEGDEVGANAVLLRLEDDEQRSQLARTDNDLDRATRELEQQKRLHERGVTSDQAFEAAGYEHKRLALLKADALRALRYTTVRAPLAGTITQRLVERGDFVTPNQPLFQVTDFDSLVTRVYVPEKELSRLAPGQRARLTAPATGDAEHTGTVARIAPQVDPKSGTVKVTIDVPRSSGLAPGMFVDVALVTERHPDAVLVPKRALVYDNDLPYVFKLTGDDRVTRMKVEVALDSRLYIEPAGGFAAGDRVVIAGQVGLKDGAKVEVKQPGAAKTAHAGEGDKGDGGDGDDDDEVGNDDASGGEGER
ncbi:efflux RND transporter periplasmic adaptor subunit [Haliangium sp.]|uniref:efflux RND transporter periplasmic adaptor subunit n=1 Tax=Haliangium sp. TaxID=2663208 RepID=UPI003D126101